MERLRRPPRSAGCNRRLPWLAAAIVQLAVCAPLEAGPAKKAGRSPARTAAQERKALRAAMASIGCPKDKIVARGCGVCKTRLHKDHLGLASEPLLARFGRYTRSNRLGLLLRYRGCTSRADGENQVVLLEQRGRRGAWKVVDRWSFNDLGTFIFLRTKRGHEHVLCLISAGQQGCYDSWIAAPNYMKLKLKGWVFGRDAVKMDCAGRTLKVLEVKDLDGDRDDDLRVELQGRAYKIIQSASAFKVVRTSR